MKKFGEVQTPPENLALTEEGVSNLLQELERMVVPFRHRPKTLSSHRFIKDVYLDNSGELVYVNSGNLPVVGQLPHKLEEDILSLAERVIETIGDEAGRAKLVNSVRKAMNHQKNSSLWRQVRMDL